MSALSVPLQPGRPRLLPPAWPLTALFGGFVVWWLIGLAPFVWVLAAIPMTFWLVQRRPLLVPRGTGVYLAFLAWMLLTASQIDTTGRMIGFVFRTATYVSPLVFLLYVYNQPRWALPARRVTTLLAGFWLIVAAGGYLGLVMPDGTVPSLVAAVMPAGLRANEFVAEMLQPTFAQVMDFVGYPLPRPAAPFLYTNNWGAAFSLTFPFVLWVVTGERGRLRTVLLIALPLGIIPAIISVNRGLWLSLTAGLLYAAGHFIRRRHTGTLIAVGLFVVTVTAIAALTPLRTVIADRAAADHDNSRTTIYAATAEDVAESPLLGYGAPRPYDGPGIKPPLGTQGQLWFVAYSHGVPGAALFLVTFGYLLWRLRGGTSREVLWVRVMLVTMLVQLPVYELLEGHLSLIMLAVGMALREVDRPPGIRTPGRAVVPV